MSDSTHYDANFTAVSFTFCFKKVVSKTNLLQQLSTTDLFLKNPIIPIDLINRDIQYVRKMCVFVEQLE